MIPRGLPDRQANLLAFLQIRSSTTRAGYQQMAGISRGTARADLKSCSEQASSCSSVRAVRHVIRCPQAWK